MRNKIKSATFDGRAVPQRLQLNRALEFPVNGSAFFFRSLLLREGCTSRKCSANRRGRSTLRDGVPCELPRLEPIGSFNNPGAGTMPTKITFVYS